MVARSALIDLFHGMRLHSGAILDDAPVPLKVAVELNALAHLLELAFGLRAFHDDDTNPFDSPELQEFCRELVTRRYTTVPEHPDMTPRLVEMFAVVAAIGCEVEIQEVYDQAHSICKHIYELCTEMLDGIQTAPAEVRPIPARTKPTLIAGTTVPPQP